MEKNQRNAKDKPEEEQNSARSSIYKFFVNNALLIILMIVVLFSLHRSITNISNIEKDIENLLPKIQKSVKKEAIKNANVILNKLEFEDKLTNEHSDLLIRKAHKYEYLRIVSDALDKLSNGDINTRDLELLQYYEDQVFNQHLNTVLSLLNSQPKIASDQDLMLTMSSKLKIHPHVIVLDISTSGQNGSSFSFQSIRERMGKLFSVKDLQDQKLTLQSLKESSRSQNWIFTMLENHQYNTLINILSKTQVKNQIIDVFPALQIKSDLRSQLLQMQKILLE